MTDLSLLNAILLCLLTALLGVQLSTGYLARRREPARNDLPPYPAHPEAVDQNPIYSATNNALKLADIQSKQRISSEPIRSIGTKAADDSRISKGRVSPTCFRINGIPSDWGKDELQEKLTEIDPDLDFENVELSIFPACSYSIKTQTAVLRLGSSTPYFEGWKQGAEKQIPFKRKGRRVRLNIDKHFYGLTPLSDPESPITADIVAITGLAGHAFGSWQNRETHAMWLYDFLPEHFPSARIMTYGYNSSLLEPNGARLTDHRKGFMEELRNARADCPKRPLVFIGHSLGGILVAQTMLQSFLHTGSDSTHGDIFNSVRGIFFFGTPHQGLNVDDLKAMVAMQAEKDNYELPQLFDQLDKDSESLWNQKEACISMWEKFAGKVCSFYETGKTETVSGSTAKRGGPKVQKVTRFSALLGIRQECSVPIISNHSDMVKFARVEGDFETVVRLMSEWLVQTSRATLESVVESIKPMDFWRLVRLVDQKKHLARVLDTSAHEEHTDFHWIFQNMDYKDWKHHMRTLVISAPPERKLENAACHIVYDLQGSDAATVPLYFFFRASRSGQLSTWKALEKHEKLIADSLCTFLWQLMQRRNFLETETPAFLKVFLHNLLACRDDSELPAVLGGTPAETLKILTDHSSLGDLIVGFEQALNKALDDWPSDISLNRAGPRVLFGTESQQNQRTPKLTFVFDIGDPPLEVWKALLATVRTLHRSSLVPAIKVLVTNPPSSSGDLGLRGSLSEIHLECDKERQACLRSLQFENLRYEQIEHNHKLTLGWFSNSEEYKRWISSEHSSLLFIEGKPGSGKSTLMRFLRENSVAPPHSSKANIVGDFFYSSRDELHKRHDSMLRSVLYRILEADESSFVHFQPTYRRLRRPGSDGVKEWSYQGLKGILLECSRHQLRSNLVLIIDALDESDDNGRYDIITLLWDLAVPRGGTCVKVCLASRPITARPYGFDSGYHYILLQEKNTQDITKYTGDFLGDLSLDDHIKVRAQEYILHHADGVFLWVRLIEKDLKKYIRNGRNRKELLGFLESLPNDLEKYYESMLRELKVKEQLDLEHGKRVLQFCLFAHRPLGLAELHQALAISADEDEEFDPNAHDLESYMSVDIRGLVIHSAGHFVEIKMIPGYSDSQRGHIVQVMHQTVREFFLRPHPTVQDSAFHTSAEDAHRMFKITCIRYLRLVWAELCNGKHARTRWPFLRDFSHYLDERPFLQYVLEYLTPSENDSHISEISALVNSIDHLPAFGSFIFCRVFGWPLDSAAQEQLNLLLMMAAKEGCIVAVDIAAAVGAMIHCDDMDERQTPLHFAANNGHEAVVRLLVETLGANKEAKTSSGKTPLHLAARNGHEAVVQLLVETFGANNEARADGKTTPLHLAASSGQEAVVNLLVKKLDSNKEIKDQYGRTPLHLAASSGHQAVVRLLVETLGSNHEAKTFIGMTPTHLAASNGHEAVVRLLVETLGANKEATNNEGQTPLHLAAYRGREAIVRLLVETLKANVEAEDRLGSTPLHLAALFGHKTVFPLLVGTWPVQLGADMQGLLRGTAREPGNGTTTVETNEGEFSVQAFLMELREANEGWLRG